MNLEANLSKREIEVAEMIAFSTDRKKAAERLFISEGTLSAHSYRIYEKLEINKQSELVIWWFMKKLGVKKEQIPYFKLVPVLILCFGILSEKEMICRRRLRVDRMARVEIKITA
ncbi:response regulator transcription factor [Elizabethkingia meningoseptica]|uniref:response regulator transcription factor n=1 Tax=Elizabethkingia meningoseptica TaxID=238 RepID=UPI003891D35C